MQWLGGSGWRGVTQIETQQKRDEKQRHAGKAKKSRIERTWELDLIPPSRSKRAVLNTLTCALLVGKAYCKFCILEATSGCR